MHEEYDILVVEDEPVVLAAIRKIVESDHIRMDEALNGEIALSKMKRNTYRLVVSDLMLPRISGLDLIAMIKESYPHTPVVLITGYATQDKALQSFKKGSFDFIPKPFDTELFLGVVRRGMNFNRRILGSNPDQRAFVDIPLASSLDQSPGSMHCLGQHAWILFEEEQKARIGVGETFPGMMDNLASMEILVSQEEVIQGKCCIQFVTGEGFVNMFWAPLSGNIITMNESLEKDIQLINTDPYGTGWIFRIQPTRFREESQYLKRCERR